MVTLVDVVRLLKFYFEAPHLTAHAFEPISSTSRPKIHAIVGNSLETLSAAPEYIQQLKEKTQKDAIPVKELFNFLRLALMGDVKGPAIYELIEMLGVEESKKRIASALLMIE